MLRSTRSKRRCKESENKRKKRKEAGIQCKVGKGTALSTPVVNSRRANNGGLRVACYHDGPAKWYLALLASAACRQSGALIMLPKARSTKTWVHPGRPGHLLRASSDERSPKKPKTARTAFQQTSLPSSINSDSIPVRMISVGFITVQTHHDCSVPVDSG